MNSMQSSSTHNNRTVMVLPRIGELYDILYDRIYMVLNDLFLDHPFTFFLMALPRTGSEIGKLEEVDREKFEIQYGGLQRQRQILEYKGKISPESLDEHWAFLKQQRLSNDRTKVGSVSQEQIQGESRLSQLPYGSLKSYFENPDPIQVAESKVLNYWFENVDERYYFSVPLFQFGELDGQIHLILHTSDLTKFIYTTEEGESINVNFVKKVIKAIIREYEGILLDWEVEGENFNFQERAFMRVTDPSFDVELYQRLENNPILKELDLKEHYQLHKPYFESRFNLADLIPAIIKRQYHLTAIMTIMIESYAHNISAHSLTALEWWFRQRSLHLGQDKDILNIQPRMADSLLVHEIHTTIRYLQDKGAFWTGLTREKSFGGKTSSLYSILWYGFARNSLLFGTIAFSEGILRVNIKISIVKNLNDQNNVWFTKQRIHTGHFATIDLKAFYDSVKDKSDPILDLFVKPGSEFDTLKPELKKLKAFFPGAIVGQHSFYSILENELRNVKHYTPDTLKEMKENGLTLHISFEEQKIDPLNKNKEEEYLLVGVWLDHLTMMNKQRLTSRLKRINDPIIDDVTNKAHLGGSSQDKICAAFLFNNSFYSVEQKETERDKRFYPWIKLGASFVEPNPPKATYEEVVMSARRYYNEEHHSDKATFESKLLKPRLGYFKKFFHLWKGADVYMLQEADNFGGEWENTGRFRFVNIGDLSIKDARRRVREEGIIRVIDVPKMLTLAEAYQIWLNEWLGSYLQYQVQFYVKDDLVGLLHYANGQTVYYNKSDRKNLGISIFKQNNNFQHVNLIHGSDNEKKIVKHEQGLTRYRSHGIFKQYFLNSAKVHEGEMEEVLAAELLEVLATKIVLFDNRVAERLEHVDQVVLKDQLLCESYREDVSEWEKQKELGFDRFHIMVLHLSFIEAFVDAKKGKMYSEEDIKKFLEEEILSNPKVQAKRNFLLVITTGRGRTQWWEKLKEDHEQKYTSFITFRPVEAILSTIEDAFSIQDDIELKYRLIKILFGS